MTIFNIIRKLSQEMLIDCAECIFEDNGYCKRFNEPIQGKRIIHCSCFTKKTVKKRQTTLIDFKVND